MIDFTGKCALITGASGGIGGAIARLLHRRGATLALTDMRSEGMEGLSHQLGERVHVFPANLTDAEAPARLVAETEAALGRIDILVNNAGLTRDGLALRMKDEDWQLVIDVNLTASFRLMRACLRTMMRQRWGRIVGIASVVGVTGNSGQANYAASKGGMIAMSKAVAQEVAARGITINCVAPGFIATAMTDALSDEQKERLIASIPGGRLGTSDDVAAAVAFLASDEAAYITGQTIHVNGGMAMI
jgi:3-oxoacyl-[acyl-carrier protein] reductase